MRLREIMTGVTIGMFLLSPAVATAETGEGETLYRQQCAVCHSTAPVGMGMGPTMFGIVGRPSGSVEGFPYSQAMSKSGLIWDRESLDVFLTAPGKMIPRSGMSFAGLRDKEKRSDLITYLETLK